MLAYEKMGSSRDCQPPSSEGVGGWMDAEEADICGVVVVVAVEVPM